MAPSGYGLNSSFRSVGKEVIFGEHYSPKYLSNSNNGSCKKRCFFFPPDNSLILLALQIKINNGNDNSY